MKKCGIATALFRFWSPEHGFDQAPRRRRPSIRCTRVGPRRRRRRSAPASPRPRWPARSTARSSTRPTSSSATPTLAIVTDRDPEGLEVIRHSTAHLLAYAVKELFPDAQVTIGPVIEDGFYYDFAYKRPFTPDDLAAIETTDGRTREEGRAGRAHGNAARRRGEVLRGHGRALQGGDHRLDPVERADLAVPRRRLHRPVPRPARAVDRAGSRCSS